ncbi:TIM44-like domain-containing protein [Alsobacter sp. SYSU M60028]|uniref:TIM44-like domain-containing protein n=1 Tax=Alsobacter ponti TaxID=2962936 RepID=A0ABT1LC48_9HYPH|nr:TIM44-like domain-containing protein [Alsobacter ponti]MCP8939077.1 TIM44-like domain-containing protein [Alsobacter ponti]
MTVFSLSRTRRAVIVATAVLALGAGIADARPAGGGSFGSRGARTYSAPPPTSTAPRTAAPIERSITQPGQPGIGMQRPAQPAQTGGFRPGFGTGLLGGLLGAGLFGMLFGHGMFGGLGGIASLFGLLLQLGLIAGLVMLAMRFFRNRNAPAYAGPGGQLGDPASPVQRSALGGGLAGALSGGLGGLGGSRASNSGERADDVGIGPADYEAFERNLKAVNAAWDSEDLGALRGLATPEMVSYFGEELAGHAGRGLHDRVSDVKLLQGDLAEAWREGGTDYATVAMRFSLVNALTERATGRVIEGDAQRPQEATEVWTFRRERGGPWMLSAIQQS